MGFGPREILLISLVGIFFILPLWRIFRRLGYPGPISLAMLIPVVNLVLLFFLAYTDWPIDRRPPR